MEISQEAIVREAIAILNQEGLEKLSMRTLAGGAGGQGSRALLAYQEQAGFDRPDS